MKKIFCLLSAVMVIAGCNELEDRVFKVNVTAEHGTVIVEPSDVKGGETVKLTASPERGYEFNWWEITSGNVILSDPYQNPIEFVMPEGDVNVKALFATKTFPITVRASSGGRVEYAASDSQDNPTGTVNSPSALPAGVFVTLRAIPDENYRLAAWKVEKGNIDVSTTDNVFVMPEEEVVIVAEFEKAVSKVEVRQPAKGHISVDFGGADPDNVEAGQILKVKIESIDEGYKFKGWAFIGYSVPDDYMFKEEISFRMPANDIIIEATVLEIPDNLIVMITDPVFKAYAEYCMDNEYDITIVERVPVLPFLYWDNDRLDKDNAVEKAIRCAKWDTDGDGRLSESEAAAVKMIDLSVAALADFQGLSSKVVRDVSGLEYFSGMEYFSASGQEIESIDLKYPGMQLKTLIFETGGVHDFVNERGALKTLNLSGCTELEYLSVFGNGLTQLDVTKCNKLVHLDCHSNDIKTLDITESSVLLNCSCFDNEIGEINMRNMASVSGEVFRGENDLKEIKVFGMRLGRQRLGDANNMANIRMVQEQVLNYWEHMSYISNKLKAGDKIYDECNERELNFNRGLHPIEFQ